MCYTTIHIPRVINVQSKRQCSMMCGSIRNLWLLQTYAITEPLPRRTIYKRQKIQCSDFSPLRWFFDARATYCVKDTHAKTNKHSSRNTVRVCFAISLQP